MRKIYYYDSLHSFSLAIIPRSFLINYMEFTLSFLVQMVLSYMTKKKLLQGNCADKVSACKTEPGQPTMEKAV